MYDRFHDGDGPVGRYLRNFFSDYDYKGVILDIGGGPAIEYSFSKHFQMNGWRCIIVEPNDKHVEEHKLHGHEVYQYAVSNSDQKDVEIVLYGGGNEMGSPVLGDKSGTVHLLSQRKIIVDVITLNTFLKNLGVNQIDIMSVDVEGWELEVIEGLDTSVYDIKFIILENFWDQDSYRQTMKSKGYELINKFTFNEIYKKVT